MVREWENSLERLGELPVNKILEKLEGKWIGILACAGKISKKWTEDDRLWEKLCFNELSLDFPLDPLGNSCPTFKLAYCAWRESFAMYPWDLVTRGRVCWDGIRKWLSNQFVEALVTLQTGASESEIDALETTLGVELPLATRLLYRLYDGQVIEDDGDPDIDGSPLGLIGGYTYYDNTVNVFLLSISQIIRRTRQCRSPGQKYIVIATSSTTTPKVFFLNCEDGQVHVATRNFEMNRKTMPCVPSGQSENKDGMLRWLEEHNRRLQTGIITTRGDGIYKSISLYPEQYPLCSTQITQGIQIRASAVLVPEFCDSLNALDKYLYVYSVRMSLVPNTTSMRSFRSCQLSRRKWIQYIRGDVSQEFEGAGVIGEYPILSETDDMFMYESWASLRDSPGSMDGWFTFIPGSISDPRGSSFDVGVADFPLELPDFIF